jgi:hypothetical protein
MIVGFSRDAHFKTPTADWGLAPCESIAFVLNVVPSQGFPRHRVLVCSHTIHPFLVNILAKKRWLPTATTITFWVCPAYFLEFEDGDEMVMSLVDDFLALTSNGMVFFSIYAVCGHEYVYKDNNPKFEEAHDTQDENWWQKFEASLLVRKEGISYNQMVKDKCKSFIQGLQALDSSCVSFE